MIYYGEILFSSRLKDFGVELLIDPKSQSVHLP